jgi:multidrug efflux system outer membrane protein
MKRFLLLLILTGACNMQPRYCRPEPCIPGEWRIQPEEISCNPNNCWWTLLQDPVLNELVMEALEYNQDIKTAIYRVEQFMAQLGISRSQLYPQISANLEAIREKESATTILAPIPPGQPTKEPLYTAVLNGSWYIDLWGLIRSSNDVALHQLLAQIEVRKTVVLTVVSGVVNSYIQLRQFDLQRAIAQELLDTRFETLKLIEAQYHLGQVSDIEVEFARANLATAQSDVEQLTINIGLEEDLLSILIGKPPQDIRRGNLLTEMSMPPKVPTFLPSDLLNQRPEILAAEQNLIAANAQIGVARAQFFPQISLTGAYGTQSSYLHDLLKNPSTIWQYGVTILQEIFTGGRLTYQLRLAEAQKETLVHAYQQAVLNGFKEVNDALIAHTYTLRQVQEQKSGVNSLLEFLRLNRLLYEYGQIDYLTLLDAERQLFSAQLNYAQVLGSSFTTLIGIYQALGGGWVVDADNYSTQSEYCN